MEATETIRPGKISGTVNDAQGANAPIRGARIRGYARPETSATESKPRRESRSRDRDAEKDKGSAGPGTPVDWGALPHVFETHSDAEGHFQSPDLLPGNYLVTCEAFVPVESQEAEVDSGCCPHVCFSVPINFQVVPHIRKEDCGPLIVCDQVTAGTLVVFRASYNQPNRPTRVDWEIQGPGQFLRSAGDSPLEALVNTAGIVGRVRAKATLSEVGSAAIDAFGSAGSTERPAQPISGVVGVNLRRSATHRTGDQPLWVAIRNRTRAISFSGAGGATGYKNFIDRVLCKGEEVVPAQPRLTREISELGTHVHGVAAYELLKTATEVFLLLECGVFIKNDTLFDEDEEAARLGETVSLGEISQRLTNYLGQNRLPYIERVVRTAFPGITRVGGVHCEGVLTSRVDGPCLLELIWSYFHEEGMLVQTINAVSRRFQNMRGPGDRDPLAHVEIDPLRPLNNLLWGYIQDEWNRLTVKRRAYEYDHHYGLTMYGKAVPSMRPADSRSKFLEGFHNLLHVCSIFFKEDNDTTVIADGYPLLNALKEVHLLLAQGAHNQFGDLPWTSRVEMLIQEWLLSRQEMRDFLQSRAMVPYKEEWMPQVDTMKTMQGWTDVTVTHFRDLGVYGEQILLSIRYGDWIDVNDEDAAKNWARYWRAEIQGYLHAYRAATGVDLTNPDTVDSTMPAVLLQKRLASQRSR